MRKQSRVKIRTEHSHSPKDSDLFSAFWKSLPYVSLIIYKKKEKLQSNWSQFKFITGSTVFVCLPVHSVDPDQARYPQGQEPMWSGISTQRLSSSGSTVSPIPLYFLNSAGKKQSFSAWKYIHFTLPMCNDVYFIGCQFSSFFNASAVYAQQRLSSHLKLQGNPALRPPR